MDEAADAASERISGGMSSTVRKRLRWSFVDRFVLRESGLQHTSSSSVRRDRAAHEDARGSRPRGSASSCAQVADAVATCSVPSRAIRERPRLACNRIPDDGRPGGSQSSEWDRVATPAAGELPLDLTSDPLHHRTSPGVTESTCAGVDRKRGSSRRRDYRLRTELDHPSEGAAPVAVELRENVVEQDERRNVDGARGAHRPPRGRVRVRPFAAPPASRNTRRSRPPRSMRDVVKVRADARDAALDIDVETRRKLVYRRRLTVVASASPRRVRARRRCSVNAGDSSSIASVRARTSDVPQARHLAGPRRQSVSRRESGTHATKACVALADRRSRIRSRVRLAPAGDDRRPDRDTRVAWRDRP